MIGQTTKELGTCHVYLPFGNGLIYEALQEKTKGSELTFPLGLGKASKLKAGKCVEFLQFHLTSRPTTHVRVYLLI